MMSRPPDRDARALPISVKAVCFDRAGRVLLCRNRRDEWELPGGKPEAGEAFETCLVREVLEETGLAVSVGQMISEFALEVLPSRWVTIVAFGCTLSDDNMPAASIGGSALARRSGCCPLTGRAGQRDVRGRGLRKGPLRE